MADPFENLRAVISTDEPDPVFAAALRARLERALSLPKGVTVSNLVLGNEPTGSEPVATVTPYLAISDAPSAIAWYEEALGARARGAPYVMPDGTIGHAELDIAGGLVMLSEQHPEMGVVAPLPGEGVAVTIHLSVRDVDAVIANAVSSGATLERAPADYEYGRNGVFRDPFGHRWLVSSEPPPPARPLRHGDIGYVSLWVPDVEKAASFFSDILDWSYGPGSAPEGRQVEGQTIHHGLWKVDSPATLFMCFAVDDVETAARRVRDAGGTASEPHVEPYGSISECTDDQGVRLAIFEPPGGITSAGPGTTAHPTSPRHGDLAYVTMEVVDSRRARAFYGSVLGWRFAPGRVEDGWQVPDVSPMVGMSGGHDVATNVPMYQVDDIASAVDRVRRRGGIATVPETQPYGITSSCADDQGTRFYLGQL